MPRLIAAPLVITYALCEGENTEFLREYNLLSESDDDPVGQWIKLAKAKGETSDSDQVLLTLIVELHRKVDALSAYVKNEHTDYLELTYNARIDSISFENFHLEEGCLEEGRHYYGRIMMPVFPKREVPVYFKALSSDLAVIERLHERDQNDWNAYVTARERVMIREMKAIRDGN